MPLIGGHSLADDELPHPLKRLKQLRFDRNELGGDEIDKRAVLPEVGLDQAGQLGEMATLVGGIEGPVQLGPGVCHKLGDAVHTAGREVGVEGFPDGAARSARAWVTTSPAAACAALIDEDRRAETDSARSGSNVACTRWSRFASTAPRAESNRWDNRRNSRSTISTSRGDPHSAQPHDAERKGPACQVRPARLGCVGEELEHIRIGAFEALDADNGRGKPDLGHDGCSFGTERDGSPAH